MHSTPPGGSRQRAAAVTRRGFLSQSVAGIAAGAVVVQGSSHALLASQPATEQTDSTAAADIASRRELFVDDQLIERLEGGTRLRLHQPIPRETSLQHDAPWEGTGSGYHSIFQDGDLYRMYYKAWHLAVGGGKVDTGRHPLFCCYAESDDGIQWRKPELGLHEFQGSKQNNIAMVSGTLGNLRVDAGHPAVFKDENPAAEPDARYKAILRSAGPNGLLVFKSPDGLHWSPLSDEPILRGLGAFDSQNLAFWDPTLGKYRAYWRIFTAGVTDDKNWKPGGFRAIRTATSDDLRTWSEPVDLTYVDSPVEHLYTNQIKPYHRAPHLLIGFPTRYVDRGWSDATRALPELAEREARAAAVQRYGTAITEGLLMASRDGQRFKRWNEAFLPPGIQRPGSWNYGHQYLGWHVVETRSSLPGAPPELSLYAGESYWTDPGSAVRRYTLRLDGFVSARADWSGGELLTRPVVFSGQRLMLNFATSAAGSLQVEIQRPDGTPCEGFALDDCPAMFGDQLDRPVTWKAGSDLAKLAGKPVRLRFHLRDADLYAYQFGS
ncbi:MAG: hypothetical protein J5I93_25025 [Pirellulaceae bacterium]|nr:hypothetical protein [Pirellulaceae bacterium]